MCELHDERPWPQANHERLVLKAPIGHVLDETPEYAVLGKLKPGTVMMMGDDPALPRMPERPKLMDFFTHRFGDITVNHLLSSAKRAMDEGHEDKVVIACLLHDIANGCLIRADHGYWGAQMIAPYVSEEIAWAVQYHQPLRYLPTRASAMPIPRAMPASSGPITSRPNISAATPRRPRRTAGT
jgi:hypothetical protein